MVERLGGTVVDVDDHLDKETGHYVDALRLDDLRAALNANLSSRGPLFITGVCLFDVLTKAGLVLDLVVYVERRSPADLCCDLDVLDCEEDGDLSRLDEPYFNDLARELGSYHWNFKPHSRADVVFFRQE